MAPYQEVSAFDRALRRVERDLTGAGAKWAIVGAIAVSARGAPRFTNDIDVAVIVSGDSDAEALVTRLLRAGYRVEALLEDRETAALVTVRLWCPAASGTQFLVDLLFHTSGIEAEVVASAERVQLIRGLTVPVARSGHLIAMKLLSMSDERLRDAEDIRGLLGAASPADIEDARRAVALIAERGRNRGRDLEAALDTFIAQAAGLRP